MFCVNCGNQIPDNARFCPKCGKSQTVSTAPPPAPGVPPPQPPRFSAPAPPPAPAERPDFKLPPPPFPSQPTGYAPPPPPQQQTIPSPPPSVLPPFPPQMSGGYSTPSQFANPLPVSQPGAGGPMPPEMHWAVVLILSWITFGLGAVVWMFKEAAFVKKIDPSSKAVVLYIGVLLLMVVQVALYLPVISSGDISEVESVAGIIMIVSVAIVILALVTIFGMRGSLIRYYNTTEPIGLKLSGVMTFFFSILYFQYHFSRIARWKKTGRWQ